MKFHYDYSMQVRAYMLFFDINMQVCFLFTLNGEESAGKNINTTQAGGGIDDKLEVIDNKVSISDGKLPSTQFENMLQGMPVYKTTEESKEKIPHTCNS